MKISDNILVGVSAPMYCEFYGKITEYINFLNDKFDNLFTDEYLLVGMVINHDDQKLYENYYIEYKNEIYLHSNNVDIVSKKLIWNAPTIVNFDDMKKHITGQDNVFDLEYYLKAN